MTCAETLLKLLEAYGVDTVFGIPGVHTVELYRGLPDVDIRHVTPRHEQGAAFMADGYARASGRPGVCFLITGPGVTNAVTAMGQSYADSVPVLVISSVNPLIENPKGEGRLHELRDQQALSEQVTAVTMTIADPDQIPDALARAFAIFDSARPRPVHIEIPTDVFAMTGPAPVKASAPFQTPVADPDSIEAATQLLAAADRPVFVIGGGAVDAGKEILAVAERIDAPVYHTIAAKGVLASDEPLNAGALLFADEARAQINDADAVLIAGSELAPTDLWPYDDLEVQGKTIRIDIESRNFEFGPETGVAIHADAAAALAALDDKLSKVMPDGARRRGAIRASEVRDAVTFDENFQRWLLPLRAALDESTVLACDSTQIVYVGNASFPMSRPRSWLTSVTGYGTLGYALPAAIGAFYSRPNDRIICLVGDGGFQFTSPELMTASQNRVAIDIIVWNNSGYGEIRDSMLRQGVAPEGVDVAPPDFELFARACHCDYRKVTAPEQLGSVLGEACSTPRVIELIA